MSLIHIETQITTVLGRVDGDGNVVETFTLQTKPTALTDDAFLEQAERLRAERDRLAAEQQAKES